MAAKANVTRVLFPKPAFATINAPPRTDNLPHAAMRDNDGEIPYEERLRLLALWRARGFDERAVVTLPNRPSLYFLSPWNWGIIVSASSARQQGQRWVPFMVRWFSTQKIEEYWPEELVLMQPALSDDEVTDIYERSDE